MLRFRARDKRGETETAILFDRSVTNKPQRRDVAARARDRFAHVSTRSATKPHQSFVKFRIRPRRVIAENERLNVNGTRSTRFVIWGCALDTRVHKNGRVVYVLCRHGWISCANDFLNEQIIDICTLVKQSNAQVLVFRDEEKQERFPPINLPVSGREPDLVVARTRHTVYYYLCTPYCTVRLGTWKGDTDPNTRVPENRCRVQSNSRTDDLRSVSVLRFLCFFIALTMRRGTRTLRFVLYAAPLSVYIVRFPKPVRKTFVFIAGPEVRRPNQRHWRYRAVKTLVASDSYLYRTFSYT